MRVTREFNKINAVPARVWVEVDPSAVEENTRCLQRFVSPAQLIAVVKGDAYGHGLLACAAAARRGGAQMLAVSDLAEARLLHQANNGDAILALGPLLAEELPELLALETTIVVSNKDVLSALIAETPKSSRLARVHLAIDTGLNREGFAPGEIGEVWDCLKARPNILVTGVMSHLKSSTDKVSGARQRAQFLQVTEGLPSYVCRHLAHSGGVTLGEEYFFDAVRLGLAIYGLSRSCNKLLALRSALNWYTRVIELHWREAGAEVGYAPGDKLKRNSLLGLIPVGFAHGYPRMSRGPVLVRGCRAPLIGRVNMLMSVIDLTDVPGVAQGEIVTLLGSDGVREIGMTELCSESDLIPNLFTCGLTGMVHRATGQVCAKGDS
jgi:alanine racemase